MNFNVRHWLLGGSIVVGAAAVGCVIWWATVRDRQSLEAEVITASGVGGAVVSAEPPTPRGVRADARDHVTNRASPAHLTPPPVRSPQDLGALLEFPDSPEGAAERRKTGARIATIREEGWRRVTEDRSSALDWAVQQGEMARLALQVVLGEWARVDPASAFDAVRQIASDGQNASLRAHGVALVVDAWADSDPASALHAVGTLPSSLGTALLQSRILTAWAQRDPVNASMSLEPLIWEDANQGREARTLESTVSSLAYRLGQEDAMEAADWALTLPEGSKARASALTGAISAWVDDDPQAAGAWLDVLEPGPIRDAGVASLVKAYATGAPETALAWAETISDEGQRSSLCSIIASRWLQTDPERAQAWILTATALTDEQRAAIFEAHRMVQDSAITRQ